MNDENYIYAYNYFLECNKDKINEIINHIKSFDKSISITVKNTSTIKFLDMVLKLLKNEKDVDMNVELTEDGIVIPYVFSEYLDYIIGYVNKSITSLKTNVSNPFVFFDNLPNLEKISLTFVNDDIIKLIFDETNIKKIDSNYVGIINLKNSISDRKKIIYNDITINTNNDRKEIIEMYSEDNIDFNKIIDNYNINEYKKIIINSNTGKIEIDLSDKVTVKFNDSNLENITYIYDSLIKCGINVNELKISIEKGKEKKNNYNNYDYKSLDELSKKVDIIIGYDKFFVNSSTYEEFRSLVDGLKWYQSIIKDYPLSPLEKLTYAYDIMKTFEYTKEEKDPGESRNPSKIMSGNKIVCSGYTALLDEILNGLDDNIKSGEFSVQCYEKDNVTLRGSHSRSIIRIDDDKYNIHGYYILDPTWDSYKKKGKEKIDKEYDALSLYQYFLIPFDQYKEVFPHDTIPKFFNKSHSSLNTEFCDENINKEVEEINKEEKEVKKEGKFTTIEHPFERLLSGVFPSPLVGTDEKVEDIIKNFKSRRISQNEFLELIRNVRLAQGYNGKALDDEIEKIKRINGVFFKEREEVNEELHI